MHNAFQQVSSLKKTIMATAAGMLMTASFISAPAQAQQQALPAPQAQETVAATINDTMISTFDVRQRMRLMIVTSGGRIPESAYGQLQEKALRDLVEENLKLQEAERLEFEVDPEMIEEELADIAAGARMSVAQLDQQLLAQNIAPVTIRNQIKARLVWQRLVSARYRSRIRISDDEIDDMMELIKADTLGEQYLLSEICLPVADPSREQQIFNAGMQMIGEMRKGVPFDALARQFSVCQSAQKGGDIGWVRKAALAPELLEVVSQLEEGSVSIPTRQEGIMRIMAMRQKRNLVDGGGTKSYEIAYAGAPLSIGDERAREAFAKLKQTNACAGGELSVDLGQDIGVTLLPMMPAEALEEPFRGPISAMERGDVSEPIVSGGAYHAMLICNIDEGLGLPSRDQIENRLFAEELELVSRRYLRDIERDSSVDIRMTAGDGEPSPTG
jgi:peptidyl-prolyl cis-trans isomerase SurA